jgi:hypothetical protein
MRYAGTPAVRQVVDVAIQAQHPLDLSQRRAQQRRRQTTIGQTFQPALTMPITPATKRSFADPKQLRHLHLAQLRPLRAAKNIGKRIRRIPS